jgi:hypothetical protein
MGISPWYLVDSAIGRRITPEMVALKTKSFASRNTNINYQFFYCFTKESRIIGPHRVRESCGSLRR